MQTRASGQHGSNITEEEQEAECYPMVELCPDPAPSTADPASMVDPGRHVTIQHDRSNVSELTSMFESLYLESLVEDPQAAEGAEEANDSGMDAFIQRIQEMQLSVSVLDLRLQEAMDSTLNLGIWEEELRRVQHRGQSLWRPTGFFTPAAPAAPAAPSHPSAEGDVTFPLMQASAKLPIRLEFPQFGDSRDSADVTDFVEQCENILALQPWSDMELLGTLNAVLKGPARSWWLAMRSKVQNWERQR